MTEPLLTITRGVLSLCGKGYDDKSEDFMFQPSLRHVVYTECKKKANRDGDFFTVPFRKWNLFVVRGANGGLTVMLPEEYK